MVPVLTHCTVTAQPRTLHTALHYIENYVFADIAHSAQEYHLTAFAAVAEYIKSITLTLTHSLTHTLTLTHSYGVLCWCLC
jgi:hypothetical protein